MSHLELLKKYIQCLDIYDGYPEDAVAYGRFKNILTEEEAKVLSDIWDELP